MSDRTVYVMVSCKPIYGDLYKELRATTLRVDLEKIDFSDISRFIQGEISWRKKEVLEEVANGEKFKAVISQIKSFTGEEKATFLECLVQEIRK